MESNRYQPPVRKSLSDEELQARVDYATSTKIGIEPMMDLVVAQEALRAQEDLEIKNWIYEMEEESTPESLEALQKFHKTQKGAANSQETESAPEEEVVEHEVEAQSQELENEPEVIQQPTAFSWFTQPEPAIEEGVLPSEPVVEDEPVEDPADEEVVEQVVDEVVVEEPVVEEPFVEELVLEQTVSEELVLEELVPDDQEELPGWSPISRPIVSPVGNETEDEFELLLASAAAEEELTVLEELESTSISQEVVSGVAVANTVIPSDEHRNRKPLSQLLVWLGVSGTIIPISLTWILITLGLSATTIAIDLVIGYFFAGSLIATASLAGKRSGLSTAIVSRAVFGVWGNAIPGTIALIVRLAVAALIVSFTALLIQGIGTGLPDLSTNVTSIASFDISSGLIYSATLILVIGLLALVRGRASHITQLVLSSIAFVSTLAALSGFFSKNISFAAPGASGFVTKQSVLGIAIVVMVVLVLWAAVAPNLAKSIPMRERGIRVFGWVALANFVSPALISLAALAWLGPRAKQLAVLMPIDSQAFFVIVSELPQYARIGLLVAVLLTLSYALLLSLKTAALDLTALTSFKRVSAALSTVVLAIAALALFAVQPKALEFDYLVNVFLLVSTLSAGWIGMIVADVALRRIAYHELSLSRSYGFYKRFSIISILSWVITVAVAFALVPINLMGFAFSGFGDASIGLARDITSAPIGFAIALALGMLLTLAVRIPEIRKQEREVLLVESRREQLNNIFLGQE
jgi:purine-cytosine permease-like protein